MGAIGVTWYSSQNIHSLTTENDILSFRHGELQLTRLDESWLWKRPASVQGTLSFLRTCSYSIELTCTSLLCALVNMQTTHVQFLWEKNSRAVPSGWEIPETNIYGLQIYTEPSIRNQPENSNLYSPGYHHYPNLCQGHHIHKLQEQACLNLGSLLLKRS